MLSGSPVGVVVACCAPVGDGVRVPPMVGVRVRPGVGVASGVHVGPHVHVAEGVTVKVLVLRGVSMGTDLVSVPVVLGARVDVGVAVRVRVGVPVWV